MYRPYIVRRRRIYLDEDQAEQLAAHAKARGRSLSALISEAVDDLLAREREGGTRLARFRDALAGAAGTAGRLPSGADYIGELRALDVQRERRLRSETRNEE